mmetsp:Transcript_104811/g.306082  ORF Transcript_104811/g.306082 Transcript_104811/m.306082 type:complete len:558 (-) Transcript_104811:134-1807(-)
MQPSSPPLLRLSFSLAALLGASAEWTTALPVPTRARAECNPAGTGSSRGCVVRLSFSSEGGQGEGAATAWATYMPAHSGGWPHLEVTTRSAADEVAGRALEQEAFAAGLLEGALTCSDTAAYWHNVYTATAPVSDKALRFIEEQDRFVRAEAQRLGPDEDYWHAVGMVLAQFDGMLQGHNTFCPEQRMTAQDLLLLNLDGDLFDIMVAFPTPDRTSEMPPALHSSRQGRGHFRPLRCSALFKLLPDSSDIFFGHDTWDTYAAAGPRCFKTYTLPVRHGSHVRRHVNFFSSSPGYLSSVDDYYTIAGTSELVVIETSLDVNNLALYRALTPSTVPCWLRAMAANMLAHNPADWAALFSRLHSGTYNNQWMVLDLGIFSSRGPVDGSFWVLEEIPGKIVSEDMSHRLREDLYWASYNVAFFSEVREMMNESSSWAHDPRAELFRQLHTNVTSIEGMQHVMGWNDYKNSNISKGDPRKAIMARGDLAGSAAGGIDSKASSAGYYRSGMITFARVGPTHDDLLPFCWSASPEDLPHRGQPDCFGFVWERLWPGRSEPLLFI